MGLSLWRSDKARMEINETKSSTLCVSTTNYETKLVNQSTLEKTRKHKTTRVNKRQSREYLPKPNTGKH